MKFVLVSCFVLLALQAGPVRSVKISLYYESLCPDSIAFILNQLYPTYQSLGRYMFVDFVPFGFAQITQNPWDISCQHGPRECKGNIVTACMLSRLDNNTNAVNFVNCLESNKSPDTDGAKCAATLNLSYSGVEECSNGVEGQRLITKYGNRFNQFEPNINYVPWIVINNVWSKEQQDLAEFNLKKVICQFVTDPNEPGCRPTKVSRASVTQL